MTAINISSDIATSFTTVSDIFIDQYMPKANGEFVKVYLYLLRATGSGAGIATISEIADHFSNTEADIIRALNYWASEGILQLQSGADGQIMGINLCSLSVSGMQAAQSNIQSAVADNAAQNNLQNSVVNNAAQNIFGSESPVGKTIEVGSEPYIIVGVITQSEDSMPKINTISEYEEYSQTIMGSVMIPDITWPVAFKFDQPQNVTVRADSTDNMSSVGKAAEDILNTGIQNEKNKSNFKYKAEDIMEKVKNLQKLSESTNQQLIWIASISLLVGGIGVMNIMLVSVTERTSEIGLKKAIGARKKVILGQFLTEASVLTSIGGIIGVVLGIILSKMVSQVSGAPTAISVPAIIGSVVFSMLIGLIFGLLPSVKAANLNPIDALRSE